MARWQARTPRETLEASIKRYDERIKVKEQEVKVLKEERQQVEAALKAMPVKA